MLRIERIFEEEGIQGELDAYNPLIPDGAQLEGDHADRVPRRRRAPAHARRAEGHRAARLGAGRRAASACTPSPTRTSSARTRRRPRAVHFLRFELAAAMRERAAPRRRGDAWASTTRSTARAPSCSPRCAPRSRAISLEALLALRRSASRLSGLHCGSTGRSRATGSAPDEERLKQPGERMVAAAVARAQRPDRVQAGLLGEHRFPLLRRLALGQRRRGRRRALHAGRAQPERRRRT